ncbi:MAG: winged helix-turn-helix domain-containing protein, partial [Candidatus Nanohaloarchaea archaeon]|nr:winged helix-turn-helix domain-containing protein [Candidatus Nanohaloarchaea archaeon]
MFIELNAETRRDILELLASNPRGLTISDVSEEVGVSRVTASKYLQALTSEGKVEERKVGQAKLHY